MNPLGPPASGPGSDLATWAHQRMARPLHLMVQGPSGPVEASAVWLDAETMHVHSAELLPPGSRLRGRLDLGAEGGQLDLDLQITEQVRLRGIGSRGGFLHLARWYGCDVEVGDLLRMLMPRLNPDACGESMRTSVVSTAASLLSELDPPDPPSAVSRRPSPTGGRRPGRWRFVDATFSPGPPACVRVRVCPEQPLGQALRFGSERFRLAVRVDDGHRLRGAVVLVFVQADGTVLQFACRVVKGSGRRRRLLEARGVPVAELGVLARLKDTHG